MISHWLATKSWNFNIWHSEYIDISKFYVQNIEILSFDILKNNSRFSITNLEMFQDFEYQLVL